MTDCIICGKQVHGSGNTCSSSCLLKSKPEVEPKVGGKPKVGKTAFTAKFSQMSSPTPKGQEFSMIGIKHRWMKNRNLVHGNVTFSLNGDGVAFVEDRGRMQEVVASLIANSKNLITMLEDKVPEPVVVEKKPEPPKKVKVPVKAAAPVVATVKSEVVEVMTSVKEPVVQEKTTNQPRKKVAYKKQTTKKSKGD